MRHVVNINKNIVQVHSRLYFVLRCEPVHEKGHYRIALVSQLRAFMLVNLKSSAVLRHIVLII